MPDFFDLTEARVRTICLTVPANIYSSGIAIEICGVLIRGSIRRSGDGAPVKTTVRKAEAGEGGLAKGVKANRPRENGPKTDDPGGLLAGEDESFGAHLPTTDDLAQSFLDAEPAEEKAQLKAAIARSQRLDQSQISDDGEDSYEGLGTNLSLPGFLADFLRGVLNRFSIVVKDVEISVSINLSVPASPLAHEDSSESVSLLLSMDEMRLQEMGGDADRATEARSPTQEKKFQDHRKLSFKNIMGCLATNDTLLSTFSQPSGSASPIAVQNVLSKRQDKERNLHPSTTQLSSDLSDVAGSVGLGQVGLMEGIESSQASLLSQSISTDDTRDTEVEQDSDSLQRSLLSTSSGFYSSESRYEGSETSTSTIRSQLRDSPFTAPHQADTSRVSKAVLSDDNDQGSYKSKLPSHVSRTGAFDFYDPPETQGSASGNSSVTSLLGRAPTQSPQEDLTESKLFSHEEAESMYMSATSQVAETPSNRSVPGHWIGDDLEEDSAQNDDPPVDAMVEPLLALEGDFAQSKEASRQSVETPFTKTAHVSQELFTKSLSRVSQNHSSAQIVDEAPLEVEVTPDNESSSSGSDERASNLSSDSSDSKRVFLFIDVLNVYIPIDGPKEADVNIEPIHAKTDTVMPGMFSSSTALLPSKFPQAHKSSVMATDPQKPRSMQIKPIAIDAHMLKLFSDMVFVKIMTVAVERIIKDTSKTEIAPSKREKVQASDAKFELSIKEFVFEFVDRLKPVRDAGLSKPGEGQAKDSTTTFIKFEISRLEASAETEGLSDRASVSCGRVFFGYSDALMISLDPDRRMRESVRDSLEPTGHDVTVTSVRKAAGSWDTTMFTLPVHFRLDLARVDETITWLGGLSSVLDLGNSVMSTMTITEPKPKSAQPPKPKKGVRFEAGNLSEQDHSNQLSAARFTARIGGVSFEVCGKECAVGIESSALKFVSRSEGIGLRIDRLRLQGPVLPGSLQEPAVVANVENVRLEYLPTPKEEDLTRLLALLSPSRDPQEPDEDILLDTLLRQRRQGGLIRVNVVKVDTKVARLAELEHFQSLSEEMKKLSTVAKYLPEDDRPGILTLALVHELGCDLETDGKMGLVSINSRGVELGFVPIPSLTLFGIGSLAVKHRSRELVGEAVPQEEPDPSKPLQPHQVPSIMLRLIGDELEPSLKIKLCNLRVEYNVDNAMDILGLDDASTGEAIAAEMAGSVATILNPSPSPKHSTESSSHNGRTSDTWPSKIDISIADSLVGLNPRASPEKGFLLLTSVHSSIDIPKSGVSNFSTTVEVQKMSLHVIDNVEHILSVSDASSIRSIPGQGVKVSVLQYLSFTGFVAVGETSSATFNVLAVPSGKGDDRLVDIEIRDEFLVLETCADSTQTFLSIFNGLSPPAPPTKEVRYRTEVVPVEDMLASFTGDAFETGLEAEDDTDYSVSQSLEEEDVVDDEVPQSLDFVSSFYDPDPKETARSIENSMLEADLNSLAGPPETRKIGDKPTLTSFHEQYEVEPGGESLRFEEDYFGNSSTVGGTAHRWDSERNTYDVANESKLRSSPLRLRIRDVNFIWNMFDGYDWQSTRETIGNAVADVESRAEKRMAAKRDRRRSLDVEEEEESVIGDFLFNSIYIGISANHDPRGLARQVNRDLDDLASESESLTTATTATASPSRQGEQKARRRRLKLQRSKHHKMTIELRGLSADFIVFPPDSGETQSSTDIRVQDLEIFDHVPTSTWKKFATYMHDMGERESGTSMVHVEMVNVKPVPELAAVEIIFKATILPLRLHVDQDALDFMTRFFEFRDPSALSPPAKSEAPFLQRVEIMAVPIKLDFKPKRVDYAGLRSGRTTEFMNFFVLDGADMVLRHVIVYGVSGFDRLGRTLNDIWSPDVRRHQLPGVLAGLAPVRPLVNVGAGVRDLVAVPVREYRKDGRVVRAIQKGARAFARTTTTELARLGAKLAVGTQTMLQNAEGMLAPVPPGSEGDTIAIAAGNEPPKEKAVVSPYADQPIGVAQGLRGAYRHLERDLLLAKDAIVAMPGEVMESNSAGEAANAVLRGAPTVILRPALGVTKAVGQTLLGATNTLDKGERRRIEDVSLNLLREVETYADSRTEIQAQITTCFLVYNGSIAKGVKSRLIVHLA